MKKLTIKEKAQRYDEAIERAKGVIEQNPLMEYLKKGIEYILPELKESEDAMIIRELTSLFKDGIKGINHTYTGEDCERWVAWLEKQSTPQVRTGLEWVNTIDDACDKRYSEEYAHGEYCHEQSFKWGFQEGVDWLESQGTQKPAEYTLEQAASIFLDALSNTPYNNKPITDAQVITKELLKFLEDTSSYNSNAINEQKTADKVEPKFKVGDKLVSTYNTSLTYEVLEVGHINGLGNPDYKVEIFTDGKAENPRNIHYMECYKVDEWAKLIEQKHAWSEEDEKVIHCLEYTVKHFYEDEDTIKWCCAWLKSLKDRVQPQQEWSEEDEQYLLVCKNALAKYQTTDKWDANIIFHWLENKLKSLRPQKTWKPSGEQMDALHYVTNFDYGGHKATLVSLYEQLKKLKEE